MQFLVSGFFFFGVVSIHGRVPLHVYVANDESGNNVMGELRLTRNRLGSVRLPPGWSKIFKVPCQHIIGVCLFLVK